MDEKEKIGKDAVGLLSKVKKGKSWTSPNGIKHIPLLLGEDIVGNLWKDVDIKSLKIGDYWVKPCCTKIELIYKDEIVGMIWMNE
jgi:hypothetical protein